MFFREYIYHNWPLLLVLAALIVSLKTTVFVDRVTIRRNIVLIVTLFLLSLSVFVESWLTGRGEMRNLLIFLAGIRYSCTIAHTRMQKKTKLHTTQVTRSVIFPSSRRTGERRPAAR